MLGPSDLYKLVKEIGKFVQNIRTFATEATDSLETNFESQLQLEEIRKAQRELNEAFSFRRSINVEADSDPFEVNAQSERAGRDYDLSTSTTMAASATAVAEGDSAVATTDAAAAPAAVKPKKKIRRRVKRKKVEAEVTEPDRVSFESGDAATATATTASTELANNVPDLNLDDQDDMELSQAEDQAFESMRIAQEELKKEQEEEQQREKLRAERLERLEGGQPTTTANGSSEKDAAALMAEQSRFQQQLSGNWNDQILENGDTLEPLAGVMERLALLEEEKDAADRRLQEEFKLREENEERYYREKRALLEEAAAQIQADAYNLPSLTASSKAKIATTASSDAVSGSKS